MRGYGPWDCYLVKPGHRLTCAIRSSRQLRMLLSLNKAPCDAFSTWRPRSATGIRKFCEWPLSAQMVEDRPLTRKQYEPVNGIQFLRVEAALESIPQLSRKFGPLFL